MSFIALGVATIRAEERRCSRELWPQFGECQDNKLFRLRRRSRSRQGKQGSRRDSRPRLSSRSEASVSKTQPALSKILREIAVTSLRGARRIDSATPKSPASCPPSARDGRRAPQCRHPSDAFS